MKIPFSYIFGFLVIYGISFQACGTSKLKEEQPMINHILPALEKYITQTIKEKRYAGLAFAIVSKNHVYCAKTFGVKRLGKSDAVTPNTLFQIGSISKAITSTLVALLQKQNLFKTNDTVNQYLPEFQLNNARTPLRIWHVLSHSTGVPAKGVNEMIEAYMPRSAIQRKLQNTPITAEPGLDYSYNNAMYSVIEDILLAATGSPYPDLLQKHLLTPLGMQNVSTTLETMKASSDRAYPHVKGKEGRFVPAKSYSRGYYAVASAGGINASLNDLIPFVQLHLGKHPEVLNTQGREPFYQGLMADPEAEEWLQDGKHVITDVKYGLGWRLMTFEGEKVIFHGGWLKGFINFVGFLPDHDIGIIVLQNTESQFAREIAFKFFDLYFQSLPAVKRAGHSS